jgi:hypothetical protein
VWKAGTVGVGFVVGDGGRDVEVGVVVGLGRSIEASVIVGVVAGGAEGGGEVDTSVSPAVDELGRMALGTGSAVSADVGEATGMARGAAGVGLGCVGAQLEERNTTRSVAPIRLCRRSFVRSSR